MHLAVFIALATAVPTAIEPLQDALEGIVVEREVGFPWFGYMIPGIWDWLQNTSASIVVNIVAMLTKALPVTLTPLTCSFSAFPYLTNQPIPAPTSDDYYTPTTSDYDSSSTSSSDTLIVRKSSPHICQGSARANPSLVVLLFSDSMRWHLLRRRNRNLSNDVLGDEILQSRWHTR